jgi:D-alanyl-lipoteichoic acid acyltransferase DltB (MBOAT superfamily)
MAALLGGKSELTAFLTPFIAGPGATQSGTRVVFSSPSFLFVFLPLAAALYFAVRGMAAKNLVLLLSSLAFYAWGEPVMVLVMLGSIGFNYMAARAIDRREGRARHAALWAGVAVNLLALAFFKYANFALGNVGALLHALGAPGLGVTRSRIALPLGISFFTFHALSYLIDVYRRRFKANGSLRQVALYIAFFPQLIAGPIVRYRTIARRLAFRRHSWGRASAGLRLVVIGLAMKVLVADPLAPLADAVFDHASAPGLAAAWLGSGAYGLQIYFDFAGYSLMAIGMGVVFGFSLPRNFDLPYRSRSITEFWRRWHMTLSAWFRDYLYIPLGGNRLGPARTYRNLVAVFLLCGLWHGASWTFVLWGLWHGLFLVLERAGLKRTLERLPAIAGWAYAFLTVMLGWVLFRAPSLHGAVEVWRGLIGLNGAPATLGADLARVWTPGLAALMALGLALSVFGLGPLQRRPLSGAGRLGGLLDGAAVCGLLALCILAVAGGGYSPFLYYRF